MSAPEEFGFYAFVLVLQPETVTKPLFTLTPGTAGGGHAQIVIDPSSPHIITGTLLDFVPVGPPF